MADELTERIIGAAIEVHRHFGPGLLESVYEEALCVELELRGIPFERQVPLDLEYKGRVIKNQRLDLVVGGEVVVELKSVKDMDQNVVLTVLTYLRNANLKRALIINFNRPRLVDGIQRVSA